METGEFRLRTDRKRKKQPFVDYKGQSCVWNDELFLLNDAFPPKSERHIVLRAHCFRLEDLTIGASGVPDPKELLIGDINYRQLEYSNPACELCEGGDFIPRRERFYGSSYRPSIWQMWCKRWRKRFGTMLRRLHGMMDT